ncbi:MAG: ComEA family DNA-binding protein [Actinobacteria bacterium]|nr:ComEA family DNA-binding protein [Actinomycetota bacterium]
MRAASTAYAARHGTEHLRRATGARSGPRWSVPRALAGVALSVVLLVAGVVALRSQALAAGTPVTLGTPAPAGTTAATAGVVVVHVVGAVAAPGVVRLAAGARLLDAVAAAGGSAPDADLSAVNLARVLVDGEQVVVPVLGQQTSPAATGAAVPGDDRLDLNSASLAQLDELPGVGPVLAQRIVDRRPFTAVDELDEVSGIGSALLERLRPKVRV